MFQSHKCGLGLLLIATLGASLQTGCNRQTTAAFTMPPSVVTAADVKSADVPVYLDEIGKTVATEVVNITPQISGILVDGPPHTFVDGADLKKGQILFVIDPRPFQAAVASAQAALDQNNAQLDLARKNYDRMVTLMPSKAVSQTDFDTAKSAVDVSVANVKSSQAALDTANLNLEYCTIKSPIDGRASQRMVDVGNVISGFGAVATGATMLLGIQKIDPIYVDFTVTETDLTQVRQNMSRVLSDPDADKRFLAVEIANPDGQGKPILGKLTFLDNTVQDGTGTIKLRATVQNPDRVLWPGQFVRVRLVLQVQQGAILVPNDAIQIGQQGPYVFTLLPDQTVKQVQVSVGQRQGDDIVVQTGLTPGQRVVTKGQLALMPGAKVIVTPPQPTAPTTQGTK